MTVNSGIDDTQISGRWIQISFLIAAVLFNLCLIIQIFSVGLAYFYNSDWWNLHIWLVRGYGGLSLILLIWVFLIPFPRRVRNLTVSLPVLLGLQFLTIYLHSLPLAVFHPLIGFSLFSISTTLVHRTSHIVFPNYNQD
ncbi:DUF6220 domain-containing protein [Nostoc sp. 'Lobaria pulmonaria (5183) cyanobiont']|uniref:DUF6220 domain-containing protein n=1 Tax=Nostoc sp. 'Lobaria pulmonaria (5183) cyanobiont' TaxID=1618022 RepID=UPI000CF315E6|nr:DUF6220 domain-containing protein [Nostoc sp. 'Lobaria pulmonaria (5183) cyanobiont']AVH72366.1 hypothetical protein NLP_3857 [Nostoc sp. 'Lobaria pulmonaria (5183) cyanobiont']